MEVKKCVRVLLLIGALVMFCYQVQFAVKSIMDPPIVVTTSGKTISEITPPLMYLCPLYQFDKKKVTALDYDHETHILEGKIRIQREGHHRSWGSHTNLTFEQLIRNAIKEVPKETKFDRILLSPKLFPKLGYCFEVDYNIQDPFEFPPYDYRKDYTKDYTILLTDKSVRTYFSLDMASQLGDKIRILMTNPSLYSFFVDVEIYEARPEKSNCNPDPTYSYEQCVDQQVHADLKPRINCVPPFLSEKDHCLNLSEKYRAELKYYEKKYFVPYIMLRDTKAENQCQKPCKQQRISVSLRDQTPSSMSNSSFISICFNPNVKVLTEEPSYNWFNFIVDVGSSLGTWVGISAITLINFAVNPRATMNELFNC